MKDAVDQLQIARGDCLTAQMSEQKVMSQYQLDRQRTQAQEKKIAVQLESDQNKVHMKDMGKVESFE